MSKSQKEQKWLQGIIVFILQAGNLFVTNILKEVYICAIIEAWMNIPLRDLIAHPSIQISVHLIDHT